MATNLELRLLRLERQQSEQLRQQSAPVLDVYYVDSDEGQPVDEPVRAHTVAPQPRIAAANGHRDHGGVVGN